MFTSFSQLPTLVTVLAGNIKEETVYSDGGRYRTQAGVDSHASYRNMRRHKCLVSIHKLTVRPPAIRDINMHACLEITRSIHGTNCKGITQVMTNAKYDFRQVGRDMLR